MNKVDGKDQYPALSLWSTHTPYTYTDFKNNLNVTRNPVTYVRRQYNIMARTMQIP